MIYEYCLIADSAIDPYPMIYEQPELGPYRPRNPDVALLRVNKSIGAEAAVVLYEKNTWKLSYNEASDLLWEASKHHIRKLIISFDVRDLDSTYRLEIAVAARESPKFPTSINLREECHERGIISLVHDRWWWKMDKTFEMRLTDLHLDFTNCYCPVGCCRLLQMPELEPVWPWKSIRSGILEANVEAVGWLDDEEAKTLNALGFACRGWSSSLRR